MPEPIAIRGIGVVGGFGCGRERFHAALNGSVPPVSSLAIHTETGERSVPYLAADLAPLESYFPARSTRRADRVARLALLASRLALEDAGLALEDVSRAGLVLGTGFGAIHSLLAFRQSIEQFGDVGASPMSFSGSLHNVAAGHLSILLGLRGPGVTVSQFEMSFPQAFALAAQWIREERVERVIVGGVDEFTDFVAYCRHHLVPGADRVADADGFPAAPIAGEGAAFFVLEAAGSGPGPCAELRDIRFGTTVGSARGHLDPDYAWVIGADGHRACQAAYRPWEERARPWRFEAAFGSFPAAMALDVAAACGMVKGELPAILSADDVRPVRCLKFDRSGGWAMIEVAPASAASTREEPVVRRQ
jgi:3-oxoacyl-[acyl-carrier-protein] synthase II